MVTEMTAVMVAVVVAGGDGDDGWRWRVCPVVAGDDVCVCGGGGRGGRW